MNKLNKPYIFSEGTLRKFSDFLRINFSLHFPKEKFRDLERGILEIMTQLDKTDPESCIEELKNKALTKKEIEVLTAHFTIGETYFFREPATFNALSNVILPKLIELRRNSSKTLRIWCAGCSTGEEAYTIAIILHKLIPDIRDWKITLLATDINLSAIKKLMQGIYGEWSFRNVPNEIKRNYFQKIAHNKYEIKPYLKKMITAEYLNLAEDCFPSLLNNTNAIDIIFCRNLLMYFVPELVKRVIIRFNQCLADGGLFITSASEHALIPPHVFKEIKIGDAIFYVKNNIEIESIDSSTIDYVDKFFISADYTDLTADDNAMVNVKAESVDVPALQKSGLNISDKEKEPRKVLDTSDLNTKNYETFARELANQGKLNEALEQISHAIQLNKVNPVLHYFKALILQELTKFQDAVEELKKVIYLDPNFIMAYYTLANILIKLDKSKIAGNYFSIVVSLLDHYAPEEELPHADGLTAGRMREIVQLHKVS